MKHYITSFRLLSALLALISALGLASCNEKDDEPTQEFETTVDCVAVNSFSLGANAKVLANLDTVFFSIDLTHGVIFNADSLPKGTDVSKIVAKITFPSTVSEAMIEMTGGSERIGTINYLTTPGDSIDFTGKVMLTLKAESGLSSNYQLKVNVHKMTPDSIMWNDVAVSALPSRKASPRNQKTVAADNGFLSIIEEADGTYTQAFTTSLIEPEWSKIQTQLSFSPQLRTLSFADGRFFMLSADGSLMKTSGTMAEGESLIWENTGIKWKNIIGVYGTSLLGISENNGAFYHAVYPDNGNAPAPLEAGFPVENYSNSGTFSTIWASSQTSFITGGTAADGSLIGVTWAYDGSNWSDISNRSLPALRNASIVPYFAYRQSTTNVWQSTEHSIWLALGGENADGTLNRTVYITYDNGVNWDKASQLMQLPDYIPALAAADLLVDTTPRKGNLSDAWRSLPSPQLVGARISYKIDGDVVTWECPYIYMTGGFNADGSLSTDIWRAVLARLTFIPIF